MLWFSAVFVAVVSNLDNLVAGLAFGMRDTRVGMAANAVIAAVMMVGTAVAMTSGRTLSRLMSASLASDVGSVIIIAIGVATVVAALDTLRRPATAFAAEHRARLDGGPTEGSLDGRRSRSALRYR